MEFQSCSIPKGRMLQWTASDSAIFQVYVQGLQRFEGSCRQQPNIMPSFLCSTSLRPSSRNSNCQHSSAVSDLILFLPKLLETRPVHAQIRDPTCYRKQSPPPPIPLSPGPVNAICTQELEDVPRRDWNSAKGLEPQGFRMASGQALRVLGMPKISDARCPRENP